MIESLLKLPTVLGQRLCYTGMQGRLSPKSFRGLLHTRKSLCPCFRVLVFGMGDRYQHGRGNASTDVLLPRVGKTYRLFS